MLPYFSAAATVAQASAAHLGAHRGIAPGAPAAYPGYESMRATGYPRALRRATRACSTD